MVEHISTPEEYRNFRAMSNAETERTGFAPVFTAASREEALSSLKMYPEGVYIYYPTNERSKLLIKKAAELKAEQGGHLGGWDRQLVEIWEEGMGPIGVATDLSDGKIDLEAVKRLGN